ncbi:hypothetical protein AB3S75_044633 [Citrus x aurantiifolia]
MSGIGHPDRFSLALLTHHANPNPVQEHCVVCQQVFSNPEALINHYQTHIRGEELMNFQNNFTRVQNQSALEAQRMFVFISLAKINIFILHHSRCCQMAA